MKPADTLGLPDQEVLDCFVDAWVQGSYQDAVAWASVAAWRYATGQTKEF